MHFSGTWRPYQQRVLDSLERHLEDGHFHLVAAPGAGKTVLGLEIIRRLARPALVLSPTITIREQWGQRLAADFLSECRGEVEDEVGRSLASPQPLTLSTYQALASEFKKERFSQLLAAMKAVGVGVLAVDEAHHLRAFWWECLQQLKECLPGVYVLSLTATPPIDVPQAEWNRYRTFCGEVDEEVGVPELVAEGNLCPHQDYIHFSALRTGEQELLDRFDRGVDAVVGDIQLHVEFAEALADFEGWIEFAPLEERPTAELREGLDFFVALLVFCRVTAGRLPECVRLALGFEPDELPDFSKSWAEILLQGLLFDYRDLFEPGEEEEPGFIAREIEKLAGRLHHVGATERRKVNLYLNDRGAKLLRHSAGKLDGISEIVEHELASLGESRLRAAVLTDYIRREAFPSSAAGLEAPLEKLGAVPAFELLRRMARPGLRVGLLTGSVVVLPREAVGPLESHLWARGVSPDEEVASALEHVPTFVEIAIPEAQAHLLVQAVTELFEEGVVNCLVGTGSLLGEGWDVPGLNTLVLASVIGSFVTSNQMRGRAIRIDSKNPDKITNIWHLVTIPAGLIRNTDDRGDLQRLRRRFTAFYGISHNESDVDTVRIESGMKRLTLSENPSPVELTRVMFQRAEDRVGVKLAWDRALPPQASNRFLRRVTSLEIPKRELRSKFTMLLQESRWAPLRWAGSLLLRQRLRAVARAVLRVLRESGKLPAELSKSSIKVRQAGKRLQVELLVDELDQQRQFIGTLDQFFDLFTSARYLIRQGDHWYAVPPSVGGGRSEAHLFSKHLQNAGFGPHQLISVKNATAYDPLVEARKRLLLKQSVDRPRHLVRWTT